MKTKRQRIRQALLVISFIFFPVTIFYLSPYLPFHGIINKSLPGSNGEVVLAGSVMVFAALGLLSLFFGRFFCGWLCPTGGLQEILFSANDTILKRGRGVILKWVMWIPWVTGWTYLAIKSGGFDRADFFFMTKNGFSLTTPMSYAIYLPVVGIITYGSLSMGRRAFCHYACWMAPFMILGKKCGSACQIPSLKLNIKKEACVSCGACTKTCPMSLNVQEMVKAGQIQDAECILCGNCVEVCKKNAIRFGFGVNSKTLSKKQP